MNGVADTNPTTGCRLAAYWRSRRQVTKLRHVNHYLAYSERHQQPTAPNYATLAAEHPNLLTALNQADLAGQWDSVCRLMICLDSYLDVRGYWSERRNGLERATHAAETTGQAGLAATFDSNLFSLVYNTTGPGSTDQEYLASLTIFRRHLITFQQLDYQKNIAVICHQLGLLEQARGNYTEARDYYQNSLVLKEKLADKAGLATTLHQLGTLAHRQGDYAAARRYYQQSLDWAEETGSTTTIVLGLHQLGILTQEEGDETKAAAYYQRSLTLSTELGYRQTMAATLYQLGVLAYRRADYAGARVYYEQSLTIDQALGCRVGLAQTWGELGNLAAGEGNPAEAERFYQEAITTLQEIGYRIEASTWLFNLACFYEEQGHLAKAEPLLKEAAETAAQAGTHEALLYQTTLTRLRRLQSRQRYLGSFRQVITATGWIKETAVRFGRRLIQQVRQKLL